MKKQSAPFTDSDNEIAQAFADVLLEKFPDFATDKPTNAKAISGGLLVAASVMAIAIVQFRMELGNRPDTEKMFADIIDRSAQYFKDQVTKHIEFGSLIAAGIITREDYLKKRYPWE